MVSEDSSKRINQIESLLQRVLTEIRNNTKKVEDVTRAVVVVSYMTAFGV